jgi:hypothetical protein
LGFLKIKLCYFIGMPNLTKINPDSSTQISLTFDDGKEFKVPYLDLRFECPCATCVDEMTGKRTLRRDTLNPNVKPLRIEPVGRYGIAIAWSDGHSTGMYHFDRLYEIAQSLKN